MKTLTSFFQDFSNFDQISQNFEDEFYNRVPHPQGTLYYYFTHIDEQNARQIIHDPTGEGPSEILYFNDALHCHLQPLNHSVIEKIWHAKFTSNIYEWEWKRTVIKERVNEFVQTFSNAGWVEKSPASVNMFAELLHLPILLDKTKVEETFSLVDNPLPEPLISAIYNLKINDFYCINHRETTIGDLTKILNGKHATNIPSVYKLHFACDSKAAVEILMELSKQLLPHATKWSAISRAELLVSDNGTVFSVKTLSSLSSQAKKKPSKYHKKIIQAVTNISS